MHAAVRLPAPAGDVNQSGRGQCTPDNGGRLVHEGPQVQVHVGGRVAVGRAGSKAAVPLPVQAILCYTTAHGPLRVQCISIEGAPAREGPVCALCSCNKSCVKIPSCTVQQ